MHTAKTVHAAFCLAVAALLPTAIQAQPGRYHDLDTVTGRNSHYWYTEWYDECEAFLSDTADYFDYFTITGGIGDEPVNTRTVVSEHYVPTRMAVKGLVAMVATDRHTSVLAGNTLPSLDSARAPEYMRLCQGAGVNFPEYYHPHHMQVLDSVRWDTVTPIVWKLPKSVASGDDSTRYLYCYAYEAFFREPVIVDSLFYIAGSCYSDRKRWELGRQVVYYNYPVYYVSVTSTDNQTVLDFCEQCKSMVGLYYIAFFPFKDHDDEWYRMNSNVDMMSGPFLPIVDYYQLTVLSDDESRGTVEGSGRFPDRSLCTVQATPQPGYAFQAWDDGNTDNPRVVDLTGNITLTAHFTLQ